MRIDRLSRGLVLWAVLLPVVARAQSRPATTQPGRPIVATRPAGLVVNPHWVATQCRDCHQMRGEKALPIAAEDVDRTCLKCHDGQIAPVEKHPIGRVIPTAGIKLPDGWPATGGRLGCLTCHEFDLTAGHQQAGRRPRDNPDFLRGRPSADPLVFCTMCHVATSKQERFNPHRMLGADGKIRDQACLFCHTRLFKPAELQQRTGTLSLRADAMSICMGCHTRHIDYFEPGHIGIVAPKETVAHMAAADRTPPGQAVTPEDVERSLRAKERPIRLPLGTNDTVICSTCHNPHQSGVFPEKSVLGIGGITFKLLPGEQGKPSAQSAVALRLGSNLCGECHGK